MTNLFSQDPFDHYSKFALLVFILSYGPLFVLVLGTLVPAGTFVPMLMYGACIGRLIGNVALGWFPGLKSNAGVYAAIGAACALSGFTRTTIAVVATVAEITGDVSIILPTMLALTVSCRAAKVVAHSGYTPELVQYIVSRRASPHASGSGPRDLLRRPSSMEMPGPVRAAFLRCFLDARR